MLRNAAVYRVAYFSGNPELSDHSQILNSLLWLLSAYMTGHAATTPMLFRVVVRVHPRTPPEIVEHLDNACQGAFAGFAGAWAKMEMPPLPADAMQNQELLVAS